MLKAPLCLKYLSLQHFLRMHINGFRQSCNLDPSVQYHYKNVTEHRSQLMNGSCAVLKKFRICLSHFFES